MNACLMKWLRIGYIHKLQCCHYQSTFKLWSNSRSQRPIVTSRIKWSFHKHQYLKTGKPRERDRSMIIKKRSYLNNQKKPIHALTTTLWPVVSFIDHLLSTLGPLDWYLTKKKHLDYCFSEGEVPVAQIQDGKPTKPSNFGCFGEVLAREKSHS